MANTKKIANKYPERPRPYIQPEASARSGAEFAEGSRASALVRRAFSPLIFANASRTLHTRLSERLRKVIRSGPPTPKGQRTVAEGDLSLLKGLQLNCYTPFHRINNIPIAVGINPAGLIAVKIASFKAANILRTPPNGNSVILRIQAAVLDFSNKTFVEVPANDLLLPLEGLNFRGGSISLPFEDADGKVLMVAAAIFFSYKTEGQLSIPLDRKYTAGQILEAVYIRNGSIVPFVREEKIEVRLPVKELQTGYQEWNLVDDE